VNAGTYHVEKCVSSLHPPRLKASYPIPQHQRRRRSLEEGPLRLRGAGGRRGPHRQRAQIHGVGRRVSDSVLAADWIRSLERIGEKKRGHQSPVLSPGLVERRPLLIRPFFSLSHSAQVSQLDDDAGKRIGGEGENSEEKERAHFPACNPWVRLLVGCARTEITFSIRSLCVRGQGRAGPLRMMSGERDEDRLAELRSSSQGHFPPFSTPPSLETSEAQEWMDALFAPGES